MLRMHGREATRMVVKWLDGLSPLRSSLLVMALLAAIYVPTASWTGDLNVDVIATAAPAWQLASHGNLYVESLPSNPWFVTVGSHLVSNRPPEIILWALPWYLIFRDPTTFTVWQSTLAAVFAAVLAMGVLNLVLRTLTTPARALLATLVMGLGTATWAISADQLWPHGPDQTFIALALLALSSDRAFWSGLAMGGGVLARPPIAVLAAGVGVARGWMGRSVRPLLLVGAGSSVGLAALLLYNRVLYARWTVIGGYSTSFTDRLLHVPLGSYFSNIARGLVDPSNGVLIWSPFLLLLLPGLVSGWKVAPAWAKSFAVGAVLYLLLHLRMNRASGGLAFDYRYPLAPLVALAPLLLLAYTTWVEPRPMMRKVFAVAVIVSILAQAVVATAMHCEPVSASQAVCSFF